ncbi:MAG: TorF family putative porin [Gammaproteobacteria bacterium]|nr:TorF family putative porin [Gammaproteobacteria bacterium]MBU1655213.1 TorF family putative porin [Gammaproteobacteria bacterium]MBU1960483.1 TorF family putative porin [Gammaproteobacteria bacterium]
MKKTLLSLVCASLFASGTAFAESDWSLSGNVGLVSDYLFRGITQTDSDPAIQGGLDLTHESGFFAGVWGSNVESDPAALINYNGANVELDAYLGWTGEIADKTTVTVKALRYNYPGTRFDPNNTNEFSAYLGHDFGVLSGKVGLNYSDDFYGVGKAIYTDLGVSIPVGRVAIGLHYGMQDFDNDVLGDDYSDYSVGISGTAAGLNLGVTYTGTDGVAATNATKPAYDDAVVFSVSKTF